MINVTEDIILNDDEIEFEFIRGSGPGGQHVNRSSTAVQLRFDTTKSPALTSEVRERLARLAGSRMTDEGILIIEARRFRSQERNRRDAIDRLIELIREAAIAPKVRRETRPSRAAKERRLLDKRRRGETKRRRQTPGEEF
jgi:ribosome-associated protein